jgi:hypothetical protein
MVVPGKHQVDAGPLEVSVEEQLRIRDDDSAGRCVRSVMGNRLDVTAAETIGLQTRPVSRKLGVEFA